MPEHQIRTVASYFKELDADCSSIYEEYFHMYITYENFQILWEQL